jgi:GPH family glycoside/pentoside/hexuronide:cation symporter
MSEESNQKKSGADRSDSSRRQIILYAFGNVEAGISNQFFNVLNQILIVAMMVNPMLIGLLGAVKTLWDAVTDPVMAHITDNTRSRWGRRIPYILFGGVSRILLLVAIVAFLPSGGPITTNPVMEARKNANEAIQEIEKAWRVVLAPPIVSSKSGASKALDAGMQPGKVMETSASADQKILTALPALEEDLMLREAEVKAAEAVAAKFAATQPDSSEARDAAGLVIGANGRLQTSREILEKARTARAWAMAARKAAEFRLQCAESPEKFENKEARTLVQQELDKDLAAASFASVALFEGPEKPLLPAPKTQPGFLDSLHVGIQAFLDPVNADQRALIFYVLVALLLVTTLSTIQSVPYYALGIEIAPSYDGRTRVVTYRAVMDKFAGLATPWVPVLCFSLIFTTAPEGLFWVAVAACVVGIPSTVLMCMYVREKTFFSVAKTQRISILRSMWQVAGNLDFLKVFALFTLIGITNGVFQQIGFFLNVYWVTGSALSGATLGAWVAMLAWGLGFLTLPIINWGCRKFQKHRVLQASIIWMALGTALKWWAMNPEHPEFQFVLPFFFSVGISMVYTVLPTMMADVTDLDELKHGQRREGMFGAVMAFLIKFTGTLTPILAGAVLVVSGFDATLEYHQTPETILMMRILYSFVPAGMLLLALIFLWRYPLTRERVEEVKAQLALRHASEAEQGK